VAYKETDVLFELERKLRITLLDLQAQRCGANRRQCNAGSHPGNMNRPLEYLSADTHPYHGGNTWIRGKITVEGASQDELEDACLEILQDNAVVARADLADGPARQLLGVAFGAHERLSVNMTDPLFVLSRAEAWGVDGSADSTLTLRARVRSIHGDEVTRVYGDVELLIMIVLSLSARYSSDRNEPEGGDGWVKPSVGRVIEHFALSVDGFQVNDISHMNGGPFEPHREHQKGDTFDGKFTGYENRDANTAQTLIDMLNDATYGSRIVKVLVTFSRPFRNAIRGRVLNDGRAATTVIRNFADHTTHFHMQISTS